MLHQRKPLNRGKGFKAKASPWALVQDVITLDLEAGPTARPEPAKLVTVYRGAYTPASDTVVAVPKDPHTVNRHLRGMAKKHGCNFRFVLGCLGSDTSTTVLCHENSQSANKGTGYKGNDHRAAFGCAVCHSALDYGKLPYSQKQAAMHAGIARQFELYRLIAASPTALPKDRAAAQWALDQAAADRAKGKL